MNIPKRLDRQQAATKQVAMGKKAPTLGPNLTAQAQARAVADNLGKKAHTVKSRDGREAGQGQAPRLTAVVVKPAKPDRSGRRAAGDQVGAKGLGKVKGNGLGVGPTPRKLK